MMGFPYEHDCPIEAYITNLGKYNEGKLVGEWVRFPTTEEKMKKVFERIGIEPGAPDGYGGHYEEWFITDYDCYVPGLMEAARLGEYENLDELNFLASKIMELDDCELDRFEAAMEVADETGSVKDIINLIDNPEKYEVYPGIENDEDLGHYYIEELGSIHLTDEVRDYFDYEAYGRDIAISEAGHYTSYGYVKDSQDPFKEPYDGDPENIPDEYKVTGFVHEKKERNEMDYETFKQEFAEDIKEKLSQKGYGEVETNFHNIEKTNQNYEAISVVPAGGNIGVNYNIENAFASYEHSGDYEGVLASAAGAIASGLDQVPVVNVNALMNYEIMKEKLSVEVISAEVNEELLAKVPHDRIEDLAVVYRFIMESNEDGRASILVNNDLIERMGVTHEQLRADALENSPEIRPAVIQGMNEVMKEMMGPEAYEMFGIPDDTEEMMFIATVPDKNSGAGVLAYQDFMDQAAEKIGGDFFILPSSIHEILLVPDDGQKGADELKAMVMDVNATQVSPEERLSDNVYHYDSKEHIFELAEKFEARQQEKGAAIDEKAEDRESVLKNLKDKQKETAAKVPTKDAVDKAAKSKGGEAL
jgi:antirestriction protein